MAGGTIRGRVRWAVASLTVVLFAPIAPAVADHTTPGIDTSHHQHGAPVNWERVRADGVRFVLHKATEGTTLVDPWFARDWARSGRAGLVHGAYHFAHPDRGDARAEARYFVRQLPNQRRPGTLPPVLDLEKTGGLTPAQLVRWTATWLREVERLTGRRPMIYVSPSFWADELGNSRAFGRYPLWIAHYYAPTPRVPPGWRRWSFWQTTNTGRVSGISGNVDRNVFNGGLKRLHRLAGGPPPRGPIGRVTATLRTSRSTQEFDRRIVLAGRLRAASGEPIFSRWLRIDRSIDGGRWRRVGAAETDRRGRFSAPVVVRATARYRAVYDPRRGVGAASPTVAVRMTKRASGVSLNLSDRRLSRGDRLVATGILYPQAHLGRRLVAIMVKPPRSQRYYRIAVDRTNRRGIYRLALNARYSGTYRAVFLGNRGYVGDRSKPVTVVVR